MIHSFRPVATKEWVKSIDKDLSSYANNHGRRYFSNEIPAKWEYLQLDYTSIVWATYRTDPTWPAKVVGFHGEYIRLNFFPTINYTSVYEINLPEKVRPLREMTPSQCREIVENHQSIDYTPEEFDEAIVEMENFMDVKLHVGRD